MTNSRGRRNTNSALTEEQVLHMRKLSREVDSWGRPTHSAANIQRVYRAMGISVSTETIRRAIRGDTWGWLSEAGREPSAEEAAASLDRLLGEIGEKDANH